MEIQIDVSQDPCKVAVGRTEVSLDLRGILYSPVISQAVQQGWSTIPWKKCTIIGPQQRYKVQSLNGIPSLNSRSPLTLSCR